MWSRSSGKRKKNVGGAINFNQNLNRKIDTNGISQPLRFAHKSTADLIKTENQSTEKRLILASKKDCPGSREEPSLFCKKSQLPIVRKRGAEISHPTP